MEDGIPDLGGLQQQDLPHGAITQGDNTQQGLLQQNTIQEAFDPFQQSLNQQVMIILYCKRRNLHIEGKFCGFHDFGFITKNLPMRKLHHHTGMKAYWSKLQKLQPCVTS